MSGLEVLICLFEMTNTCEEGLKNNSISMSYSFFLANLIGPWQNQSVFTLR